jgi:predicted ATPase/class 3 adenylate cyclase
MPQLPTGTVTFLFTDIEGSTRLLQELGEGYRAVQDRHGDILGAAFTVEDGHVVRTEGDSYFVAFRSPAQAVRAAVAGQRSLAENDWLHGAALRVRMGLHTGEGVIGGGDYIGIDVNRAARIVAAGHGGQVLISDATRGLVEQSLPQGVTVRDLGLHRLKDLDRPEHLHDLVIDELPADFPPIRSLDARRTNLPAERTSFVGRDRERAEITDLLKTTRLLTLTGPGGSGKTRLALKVAANHVDRFADGVFLVDLSDITDPGLVPSAIAGALGVREEAGRDVVDTLADHLRDREVLLVPDNFEQVVHGGPVLDRLLDAAPGVTFLATSRIPLRLSGEQEYPVRPLALPDPERIDDLEALTACESVMLFAERAAAVRPGFRVTEGTAPAVAEIASRLDGLPLALELAASRVKVLDPAELLGRLGSRLPLLTGGARDLPERQRTLRAAIEWSHDLLDPEERRLFARLAAFAGGWSLDAAEEVCAPGLGIDVLDGLGTLVDNSLIRRRRTRDDETRFRMLETIREFAGERLASSGEDEEIRRRHALFVRDLAEEAEPHLAGEGQFRWLGRLEREHDNIRTALDWAEATGDAETGLRTAAAIWRFWVRRAHLAEARSRLERLLALPGAQKRDAVRARAVGALGSVAYWQNDYGDMAPAYEEALEIAREVGDSSLIAHALFDASFIPLLLRDDFEAQQRILYDVLAMAEATDDVRLQSDAWRSLGYLRINMGHPEEAGDLLRKSISRLEEHGDRQFLAEGFETLAFIEALGGDVATAKEQVTKAFRIHLTIGDTLGLALALKPMALAAGLEGNNQKAAVLLGASDRMREEVGGGPPPIAYASFEEAEANVRAALGEEGYRRAWEEGYAMTMDGAVALALDDAPST